MNESAHLDEISTKLGSARALLGHIAMTGAEMPPAKLFDALYGIQALLEGVNQAVQDAYPKTASLND